MGFYVDVSELKKAVQDYQKKSKTAQEQLESAKNGMNGIITSNAMQGKVGEAITADINNNQNALIVGLADSYKLVEAEMVQTFSDFQSTTGETSETAIISEEALTKVKTDIDTLKTDHKEIEQSIKSVYNDISDLVSLSMPKSDFDSVADEVKTYVDKIITKINDFDSKKTPSNTEDRLSILKNQIAAAEKVGDLSYTDPQFLAFVNDTAFATDIQAFHQKMIVTDEKNKALKEQDLNSMTPSEMVAKYGIDDPDVQRRLNDINKGISYTALAKNWEALPKSKKELEENFYWSTNYNAWVSKKTHQPVPGLTEAASKLTRTGIQAIDNPMLDYYNAIATTGIDPLTGRKVSNLERQQAKGLALSSAVAPAYQAVVLASVSPKIENYGKGTTISKVEKASVPEKIKQPIENGPYIKNGKPNGRPQLSGEKKLQFEKDVYNNQVDPDGILRDPNTGETIDWKPGDPRKNKVDFGHTEGNSYKNMFEKYKNGEITLDELKEFQFNSDNFRLETPSANRSHQYE